MAAATKSLKVSFFLFLQLLKQHGLFWGEVPDGSVANCEL